jgi:hypothetical protein
MPAADPDRLFETLTQPERDGALVRSQFHYLLRLREVVRSK